MEQTGLSPLLMYPSPASMICTVQSVLIHPQWNGIFEEGYDVALIYLKRASAQPIVSLGRKNPSPGTTVTVAGWGLTQSNVYPNHLKYVNVQVADKANKKYDGGIIMQLNPKQFIVTRKGKKDSCAGDSGGPLLRMHSDLNSTQVGIVSYGPDKKCGSGTYGVYTSVEYYRQWIEAHL